AGLYLSIPSHVRVNGKLQSVPEIIVRSQSGQQVDFDWLLRAPIPKYWIPEILNVDPTMSALSMFAKLRLNYWYGPRPSLDLIQMKKIQAAVRRSTNHEFLAAALF